MIKPVATAREADAQLVRYRDLIDQGGCQATFFLRGRMMSKQKSADSEAHPIIVTWERLPRAMRSMRSQY